MKLSRSNKAILNTSSELLLEVITAICSFILPRLILKYFGSSYNGITQSISQFIGCIALFKSGIGSVTRAALYKPLSEDNAHGISEVVNATSSFMKKLAVIFALGVVGFAAVYPFIVSEDFDWLFSFTLVLILSVSTFAQYFFGLTYQMVIQADQKNYIISLMTIATTIANTIIASALILFGIGDIRIIKIASAIVFVLPPIFYNIWVKKKYKIDTKIKPNSGLISQRWDAFGHQLANFINVNTDIIIVTIFLGVKEVSVYTVFYMIGNAVKKVVVAFSSGTTAAFGNMVAKNETENLKKRFSQYEFLITFLTTILIVTTALLITPFVNVYTIGIDDVEYSRPIFGYLVCASIYFMSMKLPYEQMVYAAGHFKKTRNGAFLEAIINIVVSISLVNFLGLNGVVIGTIIAIGYRTVRYHLYVCKNIVERSKLSLLFKFLYSVLVLSICYPVSLLLPLSDIHGYIPWIGWALVVFIVVAFTTIVLGFILFKSDFIATMSVFRNSLKGLLNKKSSSKENK